MTRHRCENYRNGRTGRLKKAFHEELLLPILDESPLVAEGQDS